ncbi:mycothiol synthase [Jatrophihabitans sp. DSM 45814]
MSIPEPTRVRTPSTEQVGGVRRLVSTAPDAADNPQLSEQALLHLQAGDPIRHFVIESGGRLLGYAQLQPAASGSEFELEIAVDTGEPQAVQDEIASGLLRGAIREIEGTPLLVWAHGDASALNRVAPAVGLRATRSLFQLRLDLSGYEAAPVEPPAGVEIRPFRPGQDDEAWLGVNSRAFAHHPEQGSWTQTDLQDRIDSDWFDPAGFLVATRGNDMIGYHWTKVHAATESTPAMGEVYVLGVDPSAQGLKLGLLLLNAGLNHLAAAGLGTVLLYVDESNTTAVALYRKLGFTTFATDTQYALAGG